MSAPTLTTQRGTSGRSRRWTSVRTGWSAGFRRRTKDWLDRPMTSFHLVLAVFFLLLGFGLLMVLSSSSVTAYRKGGSSFGMFKKQLLFAGVGLISFYFAMRVRLSWLRAISTSGVIIALGMLVVVLGMKPINGARSWIYLGSIGFQPSEFAKFALVVWGAHVLASRKANLGSLKELLIPVLPIAALMGALIMLEPDLGTVASLMVILFALFFFAGASWKMFGLLAFVGIGGLAVLATSAAYRMARLVSFVNPEAHPQGSGMQLLQGLYGMANGGWFGVGLGQSRAKWAYLPHAESDFIFAIVGEELGFIGAGLLIALYITLALVGLRIARRNVDPFVKLVSATSTAWLVGQAAINIFYVVGLLPVTGLTLPMISAGGSSLVVTMTIFGLLANFARREPQAMAALQNSGPGAISKFFGIGIPGAGLENSKKAQQREERKQNREWARTSARKVADERKTVRAATRQRIAEPRDQPRPSARLQARRAMHPRPAAGGSSPVHPRPAAGGSSPVHLRARRGGPPARGTSRPDQSTARLMRPAATDPRRSGRLAGWLGFGARPVSDSPPDGQRSVTGRPAGLRRDPGQERM